MNRQQTIAQSLRSALHPLHLQVTDESHQHSVPPDAQSHFNVIVVSDQFVGQPLLARHRAINTALADEFASGLHALAIHAWTPDEWFEKGGKVRASPECLGGSKANA